MTLDQQVKIDELREELEATEAAHAHSIAEREVNARLREEEWQSRWGVQEAKVAELESLLKDSRARQAELETAAFLLYHENEALGKLVPALLPDVPGDGHDCPVCASLGYVNHGSAHRMRCEGCLGTGKKA